MRNADFARRIFNREGGNEGLEQSGDYFLNLGLFNNEKVCRLSFEVNDLASELAAILPDMPYLNGEAKLKRKKEINVLIPQIRRKYLTLINMTRGVMKKMDDPRTKQGNVGTHMSRVYKSLIICRLPTVKVNLKNFVEDIFNYNQNLQVTGVVPITAGYSGESGESKLFRQ